MLVYLPEHRARARLAISSGRAKPPRDRGKGLGKLASQLRSFCFIL